MRHITYYGKKSPSVFAALWFMGAATIPILSILVYLNYSNPFLPVYNTSDVVFLSINSFLSAGIWGFLLGGRLFDKVRIKNNAIAGIIGLIIALCSLFTLLGIYALAQSFSPMEGNSLASILEHLANILFLWMFLSFFGVIFFGWIIVPFGIVAALILYRLSDDERDKCNGEKGS